MKTLIPFNNSTTDFSLFGLAERNGATLTLAFRLSDPKSLLTLPTSFTVDANRIPRVDGLWNDTCFELFLRPAGKPAYYEFNFSLQPAWQQYFFTDYRTPQPPKTSSDLTLKSFSWNGHKLTVELTGLKLSENYEVSMTTVLKEKSGMIHYMAVKHAGKEADFHHPDSFTSLPSAGRE